MRTITTATLLLALTVAGCSSAKGEAAGGTSAATTSAAPKTFIASGAMTVTASLVSDGNIGGSCADNFEVIADNSIVIIKDAASAPVGTTTVTPGRTSAIASDNVLGIYATKCRFLFTIPAIPDDSSTYFLTVDGHNAGAFTRTELASPVSLIVSDVFTPTFAKA
jgi:hypothetical protein